jgi:hypothetical protein
MSKTKKHSKPVVGDAMCNCMATCPQAATYRVVGRKVTGKTMEFTLQKIETNKV